MPWRVLKARMTPIGIDMGTASVKLVQLRRSEDTLDLCAATCIDIPGPRQADPRERLEFISDRLRSVVGSSSFKGRKCVLSLPAAITAVQHVKTAKMPPAELDKALRWELEGKLPFDPSDAVIRHVIAGETYSERDTGLEVVVIAAPRESIELYLEAARRSRLDVVGLNVEPCAIVQCFARLFRRKDDSERVTTFLDFGQACTQVVVAHGNKLVFARNIMLGACHMEESTSAALGVTAGDLHAARIRVQAQPDPCPEAEQLYAAMGQSIETMVTEITKCIRYYESVFPAKTIERAVFLGGQAGDRRLCQRVAQRLDLPAQIGDPLARIGGTGRTGKTSGIDRRQAQPAWAVAIGLTLGEETARAA